MQQKKHNPTWEHIKLFIWVVLIFELLLFCLALVVGKHTDFRLAFNVCLWLGLIIAVIFLSILLLNLLGIVTFSFLERMHTALSSRRRDPPFPPSGRQTDGACRGKSKSRQK